MVFWLRSLDAIIKGIDRFAAVGGNRVKGRHAITVDYSASALA